MQTDKIMTDAGTGAIIANADCRDVIPLIPNNSIDLLLIDPPYSSGGAFRGDRNLDTRKKYTDDDFNGAARFDNFTGDNMDPRSFTYFLEHIFYNMRPKMTPGAIAACFIDWRQLPCVTDAIQSAGFVWRGILVWNKGVSRNHPGRYRNDCEYLVWGTNGPRDFEKYRGLPAIAGCHNVKSVQTREKLHQTQKPVELLRELVKIADKGGTVCDLFMGSGSTGEAAIAEGYNFIGCELSETYYKTSQERLRNFVKNANYTNAEKNDNIETTQKQE